MSQKPWPQERENKLRMRVAQRWSSRQIAEELGVTRCAVLGFANRIGLVVGSVVYRPVWTDERCRRVADRVSAGKTTNEIAVEMGSTYGGVQKVLARMRRRGDPFVPPVRLRPPQSPKPIWVAEPAAPTEPVVNVRGITMLTVTDGQCKFGLSDRGTADMPVCGAPVAFPGLSWCHEHTRRVFQQRRPARSLFLPRLLA